MDNKEITFKSIAKTFEFLPKIFKILSDTSKPLLILLLVLNIIIGLIPIVNLKITENLINIIIKFKILNLNLIIAFFYLIVIGIISSALRICNQYFEGLFKIKLSNHISLKIMNKSKVMNLSSFENSDIYDKLQRAQKEASYRPFEIFNLMLNIVSSSTTLISSMTILIIWKWWTVVLLILIPCLSTVNLLKQGKKEYEIEKFRAEDSRKAWYLSYLLTKDTSFKEVKLYGLGDYLIEKYKVFIKKFLKQDKALMKKRSILTFIFELSNNIAVGLVTWLVILDTIKEIILIGTFVGYIRAVSLVQGSAVSILNRMFALYQSNLYISNLFEFLELKNCEEPSQYDEIELERVDKIEFKNVSFKYPTSDKYALKNISLKINKENKVAIIGKNGSGKTTLVKLLTRLYEVESGEILINDIKISKYSKESLRNNIGIVLQDYIKYEMTVRENIGFGDIKEINEDKKILESAKKSNINEVIDKLPNGIDNQLGVWFQGGVQLSGGEWQKIAISRAFIRNAQIYILDEPSAALDPISEREVFEKFGDLVDKKIGIFISHRFSTVKYANKIVVLDEGCVIEEGTHDELIKLRGTYEEMYNIQAEPFRECKEKV